VGVGGDPVSTLGDLFRRMWATGDAGVNIDLDLRRNGAEYVISVKSIDRTRNYKTPKLH